MEEHDKENVEKSGSKVNYVVLVLVVFLLVFSVVQAFQINNLQEEIQVSGASVSNPVPRTQTSPVRTQPLPTMVGGC